MAWQLNVTDSNGKKQVMKVRRFPVVVGRDPAADISIEDKGMSRRHFEISDANGILSLRDLGSSNGTLLNGNVVTHAPLRDRDKIVAGGVKIELEEVISEVAIDEDTNIRKLEILKSLAGGAQKGDKILSRLAGSKDESGVIAKKRMEYIARLGLELAECDRLDSFLVEFLKIVIESLGVDGTTVLLKDPEMRSLKPAAARFAEGTGGFMISRTIYQHVFTTGESILTENALGDPRFQSGESVIQSRIKAVICVPVVTRGRTIGILYAGSRESAAKYEVQDLSYLSLLCSLLAAAVRLTRPEVAAG
jgi:hypothetical protein